MVIKPSSTLAVISLFFVQTTYGKVCVVITFLGLRPLKYFTSLVVETFANNINSTYIFGFVLTLIYPLVVQMMLN